MHKISVFFHAVDVDLIVSLLTKCLLWNMIYGTAIFFSERNCLKKYQMVSPVFAATTSPSNKDEILSSVMPEETKPGDIVTYQLGGENASILEQEVEFSKSRNASSSSVSKKSSPSAEQFTDSGTPVNAPPIADLAYLVLNEESLKDGQITKDTQIAWLYSFDGIDYTYDPDGDAITGMYVGGLPEGSIIGELPGMGFVTQMPAPGTYTLLYQVEDERGALSNILSFDIQVVKYNSITNVILNGGQQLTPIRDISDNDGTFYVDYHKSVSLAKLGHDPYYVWDNSTSHSIPDGLPLSYLKMDFVISGYIVNADGTPKADMPVRLIMFLTQGRYINETVTTDSTGKFAIYQNLNGDVYPKSDPFGKFRGDTSGVETRYCYASKYAKGQIFYYPTTASIICQDELYEANVTVEVGFANGIILLGNKWFFGTNGGFLVDWYEIY